MSYFHSKISDAKSCPPWFSVVSQKNSIILSRLRMRCSGLKADLYQLNIIEYSKRQCTAPIEDAYHFFFSCPLYNDLRNDLFEKLTALGFNISLDHLITLWGFQ